MHVRELLDLTGTVALVTGGAGIYGQPICEALAEAGAHVIIASRSIDSCRSASAQLGSASAEQFDQADEASVLDLRSRILSRFARVDVLVNNCVGRPMRRFEDPLHRWSKSMDVNATGLFAISRSFMETMMEQGHGSIINISSIQGVVAPDFRNYDGTSMTTPPDYQFHKHGMIGLTKYLAAVGGPRGVRVNAISPGGFELSDTSAVFRELYLRRVFLGRMAGHDDIKGAIVFLASRASAYITGQNIIVDGGYTV